MSIILNNKISPGFIIFYYAKPALNGYVGDGCPGNASDHGSLPDGNVNADAYSLPQPVQHGYAGDARHAHVHGRATTLHGYADADDVR